MASKQNLSLALLCFATATAISSVQGHGQSVRCDRVEESLTALSPSVFAGNIFVPNDGNAYDQAKSQFASVNFPERAHPAVVVEAMSEEDVQAAILFANECGYKVAPRSGGHSYIGTSSCTGMCLQIDVKHINHTSVTGDYLTAGPGITLLGLADTLFANGMHLPTGECPEVGLGGHVQTGGFGVWGRSLGPIANRVEAFRIVLADGTAMEVVTPTENTSRMNDDLFWAVRGGSSGAWGVLTEVTLKPYRDEDYFSMYWLELFAWETEGAANMFRKYSELANANLHDNRWSLSITIIGDIWVQDELPGINAMSVEMSWVAPIEQADDYDPTFFQSIRDACTGCFSLLSLPDSVEPLSFSMRFKYEKDFLTEFPTFPYYAQSWQQTSNFPDADEGEELARAIGAHMPVGGGPRIAFTAQYVSVNFPTDDSDNRALPWPEDYIGISAFVSVETPDMMDEIVQIRDEFAATSVENFEGQDHRMYWAAFGDVSMPDASPLYFESEEKFDRLRNIKACVDPDELFQGLMGIPPADKTPKGCKKTGKGRKGKGTKQMKTKKMKGGK